MAALDYLRGAGLAVELEGERLRVTPADRITADLRQFVRDHRAELLADLSAANDAQPANKPPQAPAAPAPAPTQAPATERAPEADSEPQHFIRTAATATPEWLRARDQYLSHVMTCRACHAPTGRYCQTGAELRAIYNATPWS
ncbi:hypothetical protein D3C78_565560 [compost metagenome]